MTTDNIKLAVECGAMVHEMESPFENTYLFLKSEIDYLINRVREEDKQKIAKLEQELCDMTFAYNACSHLLDKINK
jgi:uncharacterized membrane-anchored protein